MCFVGKTLFQILPNESFQCIKTRFKCGITPDSQASTTNKVGDVLGRRIAADKCVQTEAVK